VDGYYLEDAVWMSQYRDDIDPPPKEIRENLAIGAYVKLIFRFAAEKAARNDDEVERMWVRVTAIDEQENYVGILDNDPLHKLVLACGKTIHFHPSHVMSMLPEDA